MRKLFIAILLSMATVSLAVAIVLSCYRCNYKLPEASESYESTNVSLMDIELSQGDISFYNSVFLGNFFRIYCTNSDSALSDVTITVITKDNIKEFYFSYIPPQEIFALIVPSRNSENASIRVKYSKCDGLKETEEYILGAMKVFYKNGDYLGASYETIPNFDTFYFLEEE